MKCKKTVLLFLTAALLLMAAHTTVLALPEDETAPSSAYTPETQPPSVSSTEPVESQPVQPGSEPEPTQPEPTQPPQTRPQETQPPDVSYQETDPPVSQEETHPQESQSWLDIFQLPTQTIPTEDVTIPEKENNNTTTTQYVVMGIFMWVVIVLGALITVGILASTHRRKHGK
ncbi:MAG TPA: hypothetical protein IAD32_03125 [Candidatus Scatavimonas merdigallinarum]|uniref:Uncharacterized protein n=1 Tax=Candidatus Scatavimonas merdigallinarum TaxID=2840914 RepID=A0A9D0ZHE8_9FIRM|nr:hypothetical protein [Candidatus Scatavimonas merdigallinarum]